MNQARINELRTELEHERISYEELAEIQTAFENLELDQNTREEMLESVMASDMLNELEAALVSCSVDDDGYCSKHRIQGEYVTARGNRLCENGQLETKQEAL